VLRDLRFSQRCRR